MPQIVRPQKGPQEKFLATAADIAIYGGAAGGGKAQPLDEPVLTPYGFRPMGELKVGQKVVSAHGKAATIIQIHPQGNVPVYRVKFIDGAEVRCTENHLWQAHEARKNYKLTHRTGWKIYTTRMLIEELAKGKNMLVPLCDPVQFTRGKKGGKIKPYTLGAILGDGCTVSGMITITGEDEEVFDNIRKDGYILKKYYPDDVDHVETYGFQNFAEEKKWLSSNLLKCKAEEKYVPDAYKYMGIEERYQLIRGLMDTDGYADDRGHCKYCTTSEQLAKDMQWLIWSIGGKATISKKTPVCVFSDGSRKECKEAYIVYIMTGDNSRLFSISRKRERCKNKKYNGGISELKRRIVSIEPCGCEECQCITIDEPDGLYVTKDFVVTHNSYALLLTPLRYKNVEGFGATVFRKNFNQIFSQGGLWQEAEKMYRSINGAIKRPGDASWIFTDKNGGQLSKIDFRHIERFDEVHKFQGSQICALFFDELTHFDRQTFFYMLSRNRSTCGVKPFVRATCNPDANSWVADFIEWWIDQDTGYPIPERSGKLRYFVRRDDVIYWANTKQELWDQFNLVTTEERQEPRSVTFIASSVYDNQVLLKTNPQYLANLKALPTIERERLLMGNWKIKPSAGLYFRREQVGSILDVIPADVQTWVRCWDLAATEKDEGGDPAYTAGVLMGKRRNGRYIVADVINRQMSANDVRQTIRFTAQLDRSRYGHVRIRLPQDPGQAGKDQAQNYIKFLSGFDVTAVLESGSKEARATPMAAQWQAGNFDIVKGDWNEPYLLQLEGFPEAKFKDMVDASANAFAEVELRSSFSLANFL